MESADFGSEAMLGETVSLASIRKETMANATYELENNIATVLRLPEQHSRGYQKTTEIKSDINLKMEETVEKIEVVSQSLGEAEQRVGEVETFSVEVNETLNQMQKTQHELKSKLTKLEGHSSQQHKDLWYKRRSRGHLHDSLCGKPHPN